MESKKVLIVIYSMTMGGAERQVITDSKLLVEAGNNVTIAYHKDGPLLQQIDSRVVTYKINKKNEISATVQILKLLRKKKYNAIMAHMFWAQKVSALPAFLAKQRLYFFDHGLGLWRKFKHLLIVQFTTRFADKIITASNAKKEIKINREGIKAEKISVMPNCYNQAEIDPTPVSRLPFKKDRFTIGFAGRFNAVKQLHILANIAELLLKKTDQFVFVLMGDGAERLRVEQLVDENNLNNHFVFTGFITKPLSIMAHFDVFILPSKREDFSVALLEAGAVGLPAYAFDVGGNKEIILDGETGFIVPPYDEKIMADKIYKLIENRMLCEEMAKAASQRIQSVFSEKKRQENLVNLLSS